MAHVHCFDCPDCGKEHVIGWNHKDPKRLGIYTIACCSRSLDASIDDVAVREKSEAELASLGPLVDSGSWV